MDSNLDQSIKARLYDNYLEKAQVCDPLVEKCCTLTHDELPKLAEMYRKHGDEGVRAFVHQKLDFDPGPDTVTVEYLKAREALHDKG